MKFKFEKFMHAICKEQPTPSDPSIDETKKENPTSIVDTAQRRYNRLYREKWQNRVTYGKQK